MKPLETGEPKLFAPAKKAVAQSTSAEGLWDAIRVLMSLQQKAPPLRAVTEHQVTVLSASEERLWRLWQMQPEGIGMNIPFCFRIAGPLNLDALEKSLEQLILRHDVLRTTYPQQNGEPIRAVALPDRYRLAIENLEVEDLEEDLEKEGVVLNRIAQEACVPFDLERGPLIRVKVARLAPAHFILSITLHHIVFDGWSEGILFEELAKLYRAQLSGESPGLRSLAIAYQDYALWQRDSLQGEIRDVLLQFWQAQLKDGLSMQQPPITPKRMTHMTRQSGRYEFVLPADLTKDLKAFSRKEGATLFATLLAAFKVLFYRCTEQEQLFVCTPIATRNRNELKGVIGYFINLLILQTDLSGKPTFREVLQRVRQAVSGAYAHQDLPFQQVVQEIGLSRAPLAQAMFALQNYPQAQLCLEGVQVQRLDVDNGVADFDLFLSMAEERGELRGELKFNADLFEAEEVKRFVGLYRRLLENVLVHPDAKIASSDLLKVERVQPRMMPMPVTGAIAPRNEAETVLQAIWEQALGRQQPIGVTDNFFDVGGNSMVALQIFNQIRNRYGKDLPLATLFECGTIERLATVLTQDSKPQTWSSLVAIQPAGKQIPIFCIHGLGGNILNLYDLSRHLGRDQPFYGLQAQGLDGKQPPLNRIEDMAIKYIQEIKAIQPHGPYLLSGLSMGGMVAFEMAQQLQAQGQEVVQLILLDTYGAIYYKPLSFRAWLARHLRNFLHLKLKDKLNYPLKGAAALRRRFGDAWSRIKKPVKEVPTDRPTDEPQFTPFITADGEETYVEITPVSTANNEALLHYTPTPYKGEIVLFRAQQQPWWSEYDAFLGWTGLAEGGIRMCEVPGHHHNMTYEPHVVEMARQLSDCIQRSTLKPTA
jgi:thioesterase domain-containing protein/NRPS condensation-like uncharacterized protein/acyl carrier protein